MNESLGKRVIYLHDWINSRYFFAEELKQLRGREENESTQAQIRELLSGRKWDLHKVNVRRQMSRFADDALKKCCAFSVVEWVELIAYLNNYRSQCVKFLYRELLRSLIKLGDLEHEGSTRGLFQVVSLWANSNCHVADEQLAMNNDDCHPASWAQGINRCELNGADSICDFCEIDQPCLLANQGYGVCSLGRFCSPKAALHLCTLHGKVVCGKPRHLGQSTEFVFRDGRKFERLEFQTLPSKAPMPPPPPRPRKPLNDFSSKEFCVPSASASSSSSSGSSSGRTPHLRWITVKKV